MNDSEVDAGSFTTGFDDVVSLPQGQRSSALSSKITSVLSTSFIDAEIREAIKTLDERHASNTPETRRRLRIDAQKEVIDNNGDIVRDFGKVAAVHPIPCSLPSKLTGESN